jgi:fructose-bisphosphate aldolase class II
VALSTIQEALSFAEKGSFAIGAFNLTGEDTLYGLLDAAEQENSPVIISIYEGHVPYFRHWETFMKLAVSEAQMAKVPVVIFLDHATQLPTIYKAFQLGFTSVMYDGSAHDYEANVANAKLVCEIAHSLGIGVEAELGKISRVEGHSDQAKNRRAAMTDPDLVQDFTSQTGIDALAVSIGTVHGYFTGKADIDFDLLEIINNRVETPLVLHGGTGLKDEEFLKAISLGVRKINYGTDIFGTATAAARKKLEAEPDLVYFQDVCVDARKAVCNRAASYMKLWGSSGKSWLSEF